MKIIHIICLLCPALSAHAAPPTIPVANGNAVVVAQTYTKGVARITAHAQNQPSNASMAQHEQYVFKMHCTTPKSLSIHYTMGENTYQSTYKLFDSGWEEIDTESEVDTLPDYLQANSAIHQKQFNLACGSKS